MPCSTCVPERCSTCLVGCNETGHLDAALMLLTSPQGGLLGTHDYVMSAGEGLRGSFAHNIDAYQSYGAEVSKPARSNDATFLLGYSKRLMDGALAKARIQNDGNVTLLYEAVSDSRMHLPALPATVFCSMPLTVRLKCTASLFVPLLALFALLSL